MNQTIFDFFDKKEEKPLAEPVKMVEKCVIAAVMTTDPATARKLSGFETSGDMPAGAIEKLKWENTVMIPMDYLRPIINSIPEDIQFVKLHTKTDYPLKIEVTHENNAKTEWIISPRIDPDVMTSPTDPRPCEICDSIMHTTNEHAAGGDEKLRAQAE
jgi:hypothetical protein